MANILIVAKEIKKARDLRTLLLGMSFTCTIVSHKEKVVEKVLREMPDLVILEIDSQASVILQDLVRGIKIKHKAPILALVAEDALHRLGEFAEVDDFISQPVTAEELAIRIHRLLQKTRGQNEIIRSGDLVIDLANCEVRVAGKVIDLTFKEYELLKFLAADRGRVFTRETLLNRVWGYDYFGGDRTVDVHVRRLRSKIEISQHTYIETVRNIGYRFKKS